MVRCSRTHPLAYITETGDDSDLASEHDIGGSLDTVNEGLSAAVLQAKLSKVSMQMPRDSRSCRIWIW